MSYTDAFERFWSAYPRKTAKPTAAKAFEKLKIEGDAFLLPAIIQDLEKRTRFKWWPDDKTKIPHPSTWLNQRRWEDEWADEIATRKATHDATAKRVEIDQGPKLPTWVREANKLFLLYLRAAGGVSDDLLPKLVKEKQRTTAEMIPALDEDREAGVSFGECKVLLFDVLLSRLDKLSGLRLQRRILRGEAS